MSWQEDTISGASELRNRAGWGEAAALVKSGQVQGVVVARLDRLARDVMVQELLLRKLSDLGGIVLSTRENDNEMLNGESKEPSRKLVRVIMGAISEYDREMTVDRLAQAAQPRPLAAATHTARCPTATAPPTASSCLSPPSRRRWRRKQPVIP